MLDNENKVSNYIRNFWYSSQKVKTDKWKKSQHYCSIIWCFYIKINILSCSASKLKWPNILIFLKKSFQENPSFQKICQGTFSKHKWELSHTNPANISESHLSKALCIMLNMSFSDNSRVKTFGHMHKYFTWGISQDNNCDLCSAVISEVSVRQEHLRSNCTLWLYSSLKYRGLARIFQHNSVSLKQAFQKGTQ